LHFWLPSVISVGVGGNPWILSLSIDKYTSNYYITQGFLSNQEHKLRIIDIYYFESINEILIPWRADFMTFS